VRIHERNKSADPKVSAEGGQGVLQSLDQIPLQPIEQTVVRQVVPCSHGAPRGSISPPTACCDPTLEQGDAQRRL